MIFTFLASTPALADPTTVYFAGPVKAVTGDVEGVLGAPVPLGAPFTGTYAIDPAAAGTPGAASTVNPPSTGTEYPGTAIEIAVGGLALASTPRVLVSDASQQADLVEVLSVSGSFPSPGARIFGLVFLDDSGTALGDEALAVAPDLADFNEVELTVMEVDGNGSDVSVIADVSVLTVPEPRLELALLVGAGLLAGLRDLRRGSRAP